MSLFFCNAEIKILYKSLSMRGNSEKGACKIGV